MQEANILPNLSLGDPIRNPEISSSTCRFYNMLHLVSSNGQYNKLEDGKLTLLSSEKFSVLNCLDDWVTFFVSQKVMTLVIH